jgi:histone deacetylase complex regulatory component SIN3
MDMTKFEDANDPGFALVTGELRRWIKPLSNAQGVKAAGPQDQQQRGKQDSTKSSYHDQIKAHFADNPDVCYRFFSIMADLKSQSYV